MGEIFGDFTILVSFRFRKATKHEIQCNKCKYKKIIFESNFHHGYGKNCPECKLLAPIGMRFGILTIISISERNLNKTRETIYEALCDCGRIRFLNQRALKEDRAHS